MASPLTVWSTTADGYVNSASGTYANAANGNALTAESSTNLYVGQGTGFDVYESFVSFDTSSVGAGSTVTVATLGLYLQADFTTADFIYEASIHDWGAALTTADWVGHSALAGKTLVASKDTTPTWSGSSYTMLTSEAAFLSNIAQTGTTYILGWSSRHGSETEPTSNELLGTYSADDSTGGGGTDRDPKLYVEWTEGGGGWSGMRITRHLG